MATKPEHQINLLPQEEFDASTLGRTIKWLQGTFRYLVITTEMVVMVAFLSRFWLDAKSNDLIDAINQKKAVVASYSSFETQYRTVQKQLNLFKSYSASNLALTPVMNAVSTNIPSNVILTEVLVNGSKITIQGQAIDEASAASYVTALNTSNLLTDVNLGNVESKKDTSIINFKITANLNDRSVNVF